MSVLGYIALAGGLTSVGLAIVIALMRLRMNGLQSEVDLAMALRRQSEDALASLNDSYIDFQSRTNKIQRDLASEMERFKKERLDNIEKEPDRDNRIRLRRAWIGGIMSKVNSLSIGGN